MRPAMLVAAAPLALLGACAKEAAAPTDPAAVLADIGKAEQAQIEAIGKKDLAGAAGVYTADATLYAPGAVAAKGTDAIKAFFETNLKDPAFDVKPEDGSETHWVAASGDLAVTGMTAAYSHTDAKSGKPVTERMVSQMVWQKGSDGGWKIVSDHNSVIP